MEQKDFIANKICDQAFGLDKYVKIMEYVKNSKNVSLDTDFQKLFNGYYGVRRNKKWREFYYTLFQYCREKKVSEITFEYVIRELYINTNQVEASFASKMLASINPDMPLWDRRVLNYFGLEIIGSSTEERINNSVKVYNTIIEKYKLSKQQNFIKIFDVFFPHCPYTISDIKKIDCIAWILG